MFISIKWKAVVFLSIILLTITTIWVVQDIDKTLTIHENQRQNKIQTNQNILNKILNDRFESLSPIAQFIPFQSAIGTTLMQDEIDKQLLYLYLDEIWLQLNLNLGIDYVALYNHDFKELATLHSPDTISSISKFSNNIKDRIKKRQLLSPDNLIYCDFGCLLITIEPVILDSGQQIYVLLGQNMSYMTQLFSTFSSESLGIVLPNLHKEQFEKEKHLPNWKHLIWALSNFEDNHKILKNASHISELNQLQMQYHYGKQEILLYLLNFKKIDSLGLKPTFIVVMDETLASQQLKNSIMDDITTGLIGWVISELILFLLLMGPIKRLINLSQALQLLPSSNYEEARSLIGTKPQILRDEITSLEKSTIDVTHALAELEENVIEQNNSLENQIKALSRSRSFLSRLLDNSQLFILTQSFDGYIYTRNQRIDEILSPDDFSITQCSTTSESFSITHRLEELSKDPKKVITHEGNAISIKGEQLYIAWSHTTVEDEQGNIVVLSIGTDLTKRREAETALTWMANHDPLTGISNRRGFQLKLEDFIKKEEPFTLVFIDINRFKQINDIYGHTVGDEVLIDLSNNLKTVTRQTDHISRLAGDEFTILLANTHYDDIKSILKKITLSLQSHIKLEDEGVIDYGTSIGASVYPLHATDSENLIIYADMAMYQAKKLGSSNWHLFSDKDEHLEVLKDEHHCSTIIKMGLEKNLFKLFFQPIMSIQSKTIHHYEVLLRLFQENGEQVFPGRFIPVAEKNGLIRSIDEWVLDNATKDLAKRLNEIPELSYSVNVSAPSLQSPNFPDYVNHCLQKNGLPAKNLVIELTETAYIENFNQVLENLNMLNHFGVKVSIDDFGVGFSSFNYLKRLPLSFVKLDGSYIQNLCKNKDDQAFVKSLSEMVQAFGMQTIAEFVEDQATLELLSELNVNYAQGYHIGKPDPSLLLN